MEKKELNAIQEFFKQINYNQKEIDEILDFINSKIYKERNNIPTWEVVMSYNRGLGVEFKNLETVTAKTYGEAQELAELQAELFCQKDKKNKLIQIIVRPHKKSN